jgi:hypothetical protein
MPKRVLWLWPTHELRLKAVSVLPCPSTQPPGCSDGRQGSSQRAQAPAPLAPLKIVCPCSALLVWGVALVILPCPQSGGAMTTRLSPHESLRRMPVRRWIGALPLRGGMPLPQEIPEYRDSQSWSDEFQDSHERERYAQTLQKLYREAISKVQTSPQLCEGVQPITALSQSKEHSLTLALAGRGGRRVLLPRLTTRGKKHRAYLSV